jgi:hypothetical protein
MCLKGDDPLTTVFSKGTAQKAHTQNIGFTTDSTSAGDAFTITFTDLYGAAWTTRPIAATTDNWRGLAGAVKAALEALPNQVVKAVGVVSSEDLGGGGGGDPDAAMWKVTFGANSGVQNLLVVNTGGCDVDGCQPRIAGLTHTAGGRPTTSADAWSGTTEANECSGRGNCDSEIGVCECNEGFTGEACEQQTVLL